MDKTVFLKIWQSILYLFAKMSVEQMIQRFAVICLKCFVTFNKIPAEAQKVADYVGDSFYLAKIAKKSTAEKGTPAATTGAAVISVIYRIALNPR